jgi:hypothetical protein
MTYACPAWEFAADRQPSTEIAAPAKQSSTHHWKFSKAQIDSRFAYGFQTSAYIYGYIIKLCRQQAEVIQNNENKNVRSKANCDTGNIRGLNLAAVKHTTVQVTRLLL